MNEYKKFHHSNEAIRVLRYFPFAPLLSIVHLLSRLNCFKQLGDINLRLRPPGGAHLASTGIQVVAIGGEEQVGEASMVTGGQQGQQGAVLAGVKAGTARV